MGRVLPSTVSSAAGVPSAVLPMRLMVPTASPEESVTDMPALRPLVGSAASAAPAPPAAPAADGAEAAGGAADAPPSPGAAFWAAATPANDKAKAAVQSRVLV